MPPAPGDHRGRSGGGPGGCGGGPESLPKSLQQRPGRAGADRGLPRPPRAAGPGEGAHLLAPSILSAPRLHVICRVSSLTWKVFRSGRCDFLE